MSKFKSTLHSIIEDNTTKQGRFFDLFIEFLILLSLAGYAIETIPDIPLQLRKILQGIETFTISIFLIEYILRIYVAEKPLKYIFSFYGIIDFIAILPYFISRSYDLRAIRAFRIFRIFRAFKLIRYNKALNRFSLVFKLIREELILFFIITSIFLFLASAGIYYFENPAQPDKFSSIFSSAWWAVVTLTTVGYGDVYPITLGGRIFTFFVLMVGVGVVTIPAGLMASALTKARQIEEDELQKEIEEHELKEKHVKNK
ncbi:MAG: ion transporter [Brumimicrobium sp.]|nr:ion transporter [Brumimicrobium sp.]MCO5269712.1 ion transporter [Brumimicrobium sp.]